MVELKTEILATVATFSFHPHYLQLGACNVPHFMTIVQPHVLKDPTTVLGGDQNPTHTVTPTITTPNLYLTPTIPNLNLTTATFNFIPKLNHLMAYT